jgi:type I restriction enzyme S subunit
MNYRLNSFSGVKALRRLATGTTSVAAIYTRDLLRMKMTLPTLPEQRKIANFLTAVDGRIGQLSQKKALLEDYKKGVMQQLFTQALRFKDNHGNDFPDWEEAEFGRIAKRSSEKHNPMTSATEYPSVELESLSQGTGQLLQLFVSKDQKSIKSKFTKGDVLFGKLRPYLRKWLMPAFDGVCSSEIWVLRGKTVTNAYLYHLIQTGEFMKATNVSSGSKMPRADWDHIAAVTFSYPASTDEQTKIANFLTALDRKIESVSTQITGMQTWKKGLLRQMFV